VIVAIDFESVYTTDISIQTLGSYWYPRKADVYLVTMASDDGLLYAGRPEEAPWDKVSGQTWLMHNAQFDAAVIEALVEQGKIPDVKPSELHDTADLAAWAGWPRSLKQAAHFILGEEMSKETRAAMKGKTWENMKPEFREEVIAYAIKDSVMTLKLWQKIGHLWPEHERKMSRMTREMAMQGLPLNMDKVREAHEKLRSAAADAHSKIPWAKHSAPLSLEMARYECEKSGIWAPESFAKDSEQAQMWEEEFSERFEWVRALRDYRQANKHFQTVDTMVRRVRPDGWMPVSLKYYGAHTGRDSGDGGFNIQNVPRDAVRGVNLRHLIEAPKGYTFVISDLSQIENRVLLYLARDHDTLELIRRGIDGYEAHARATMGYTDPRPLADVDPKMRQLAKARVLGLGFGCGADKFVVMAWMLAKLRVTPEESVRIVNEYRRTNPKVTELWRTLQYSASQAMRNKEDFEIELPEGRSIRYRDMGGVYGSLSGLAPKNGTMMRTNVYGGKLCENLVQGYAGAVFMNRCRAIYDAGYQIVMRIHDEVVTIVREEEAEQHRATIQRIMSTNPSWCPTLPLASKTIISPCYTKE
jgi:DNA polymerase I-like protein with 3'-5' exonuclease and polymerase domains